jgi:hypothetical protein
MQTLPADDRFWSYLHDRLEETDEAILLLERWARGAGQRSWYLLVASADVAAVRERVRTGSSLTAYLDPQLPVKGRWSQQLASATKALADELGEHEELVGLVDRGSRPSLDAEYLTDADEIEAWESEVAGQTVWVGKYPEWPADGEDALTRLVPDADGVVRAHPY